MEALLLKMLQQIRSSLTIIKHGNERCKILVPKFCGDKILNNTRQKDDTHPHCISKIATIIATRSKMVSEHQKHQNEFRA
jgi:hypothetical protein